MQTSNRIKNNNLNTGFTIVETLVAIGILVVALSGGFAAVSLSLNRSSLSKEQVIAFYLAQEGMEIIRNKRDSNALSGNSWLQGIALNGDPCEFGNVCRADAISFSLNSCGSNWGSCPFLRNHNTNKYYNYSSGATTIFKREIKLTDLTTGAIEVIQAEVRITWNHSGTNQTYTASTLFYNWH